MGVIWPETISISTRLNIQRGALTSFARFDNCLGIHPSIWSVCASRKSAATIVVMPSVLCRSNSVGSLSQTDVLMGKGESVAVGSAVGVAVGVTVGVAVVVGVGERVGVAEGVCRTCGVMDGVGGSSSATLTGVADGRAGVAGARPALPVGSCASGDRQLVSKTRAMSVQPMMSLVTTWPSRWEQGPPTTRP